MRRVFLAVLSLAIPAIVFASVFASVCACGEDTPDAPGPKPATDSSVVEDTSAVDAADATADAYVAVRCSDSDLAAGNQGDAGSVNITFPTDAVAAQYTPNCVTVEVGAIVTFTGDFSFHPLEPNGGDTPNPIPTVTTPPDSGTIGVTMTSAGTFGFECADHPGIMFGAIRVVAP